MKISSALRGEDQNGVYFEYELDTPIGYDHGNPVQTLRAYAAALPDRRLLYGVTTAETEKGCVCGECDLCGAAIRLLLTEHFARLNPDELAQLDPGVAERLVGIGGVPGKGLDEKGEIVDVASPEVRQIKLDLGGLTSFPDSGLKIA